MPTPESIIGTQVIKIEELLEELTLYKKACQRIRLELVGMGGPLNDNVLQFNADQLKVFHRIETYLKNSE